MERILIIGCSGSGKSTLARAMGEKTGIPVVHLDQLWWKPGWVESDREEFDARLEAELAKPRWIMDGNFSRTMPQRFKRCDTVIYLDFNRFTCLWGMFRRVTGYYGKVRPDMSEGCPERFDLEFIRWIWNYNQKNRLRNYGWLRDTPHAKSIILKNRRQVKEFLASL